VRHAEVLGRELAGIGGEMCGRLHEVLSGQNGISQVRAGVLSKFAVPVNQNECEDVIR
jgi:hypothetical protein